MKRLHDPARPRISHIRKLQRYRLYRVELIQNYFDQVSLPQNFPPQLAKCARPQNKFPQKCGNIHHAAIPRQRLRQSLL